MADATTTLPPAWGADPLSAFLDTAQKNTHATFYHKKPAFAVLQALDGCFFKICDNLLNPKDQIAPLFMLRSFSAYRATCSLAMAGHFTESFALARLCLEYGGYGLFIHNDPSRYSVWQEKSKGPPQAKAFRDAFTHGNVRACIATYDAKLAEVYATLYQRAIDTGAHPNDLGVSGSMAINDDAANDRVYIVQKFLHPDGIELEYSLKATAQVGLCSLHLFQWVFKERFSLLGVSDILAELRNSGAL